MAILDNDDFHDIKKIIRRDATARAVFKAWGLDRPTWKILFQTVEDWFVNGFSTTPSNSFKAEVETVTGTATNAQAKQVGYVWMGWRHKANP